MQTVLPDFSSYLLPDDYSGQFYCHGKMLSYRVAWNKEEKVVRYSLSDCGILMIVAPVERTSTEIQRFLTQESDNLYRLITSEDNQADSLRSPLSFQVHGLEIPFTVDYNRRRRINSVCYYREGRLEVRARSDATPESVQEVLEKHRDWVYSQVLRYDPRYRRKDEEDFFLLGNERVPYLITYSTRAKRMTIRICQPDKVCVVAPSESDQDSIREFVRSNRLWIAEKLGIALTGPGSHPDIRFLEYDGYRIPYHTRTSPRAKRIILKITAEKKVEVVIPPRTDSAQVHQFIHEKAGWVVKQVTSTTRPAAPFRQYLNGDILPLLGKDYQLFMVPGQGPATAGINNGVIEVYVPDALPSLQLAKAVKHAYASFLCQTMDEITSPLVQSWSARLGIPVPAVRYGNQKTKWGVCSPRGIILNIRLAMAPSDLIEYVIVHELCHIRHPNHSKKFWNLVEMMLPDYRERMTFLKNQGSLFSF